MQQGIELRRVRKNREALEAFQRAYVLDPTVRVATQIALAQQAVGDWIAAERGIESALQAADDPWVARYRNSLEQALTIVRTHLGSLYIEANATQAELSVNGVAAGPLPPPNEAIRVVAGTVQFEVRAPDRVRVSRTIEVAAGAQVHVLIALEASQPGAGSQAASSPPSGAVAGEPTGEVPARQRAQQTARTDKGRDTWGIVALATAGEFVAGGIVAWRVREDNLSIWDNDSLCLVGGKPSPTPPTRAQQCGSHLQTANVATGLEVGAFAGATLSAALGAWLLWGPRRRPSPAAVATCSPWAALGVSCLAAF